MVKRFHFFFSIELLLQRFWIVKKNNYSKIHINFLNKDEIQSIIWVRKGSFRINSLN